jgi:phosphatidylethanolamine-binding protein (PEBP) family uncharacterized protein
MLQHLPFNLGKMFQKARSGLSKIVYLDPMFKEVTRRISVLSPAFKDGEPLPVNYTSDGKKISPPLQWQGVPKETQSVLLIVEDADSPTPGPLTHAMVLGLPPEDSHLPEGGIKDYLPPDPPPGHGLHHYAFQLFALDIQLTQRGFKRTVKEAMDHHVLAKGCLMGTYERSKKK